MGGGGGTIKASISNRLDNRLQINFFFNLLQRSLSLRRRDGSWDRKWEDSQRNETEVRSRPWARPGKLNNSYWENRVKTEHGLPPKTPPPRRKLMDVGVGYNNDMM